MIPPAATLSVGAAAHAATLASLPYYRSYTIANCGRTVTCSIFNAGTGTTLPIIVRTSDTASDVQNSLRIR